MESLSQEKISILGSVAKSIRQLSIDAIEEANSGHPGLPLGCAELGAYLYGHYLRYNPKNPEWINRDRFILSAGHGSALLYSCLHLSGYGLSLEDLRNFRQLHSKTPGHPEYELSYGIETTTGPLGQGVANAVGQALGMKILSDKYSGIDNKVIALAGDGCMMEGLSSEACSFSGNLKLDNLILIYDYNEICLDGPISEVLSDDVVKRFEAYGWGVLEVDGHNLEDIHEAFQGLREAQDRPYLIIAKTVIGYGSPNRSGTNKAHGAPLGLKESRLTKEFLGLNEKDSFYVPQEVRDYFSDKLKGDITLEEEWQAKYSNPEEDILPEDLESLFKGIDMPGSFPGRKASQMVLEVAAKHISSIYTGSADLSCSDMSNIKATENISAGHFGGRNIKFGVREFAMAAVCSGLAQTNYIRPLCGTFLTFSDYMRNAIRLAALQRLPVIYQFTHDSIFLGEDGPTHQPVEHVMSLRAIPNLQVIRPADNNEVKMAWVAALKYKGPTALILSRLNLPLLSCTDVSYSEGVARGAYIALRETSYPDYTIFATGSELNLALDVARALGEHHKDVRVVSMPCWELFEKQSTEYKSSIIEGNLGLRISIEAGVEMGWHKYIGRKGVSIAVNGFGASAPADKLAHEYGFTVEAILERIFSVDIAKK